ncbi:hypothetical protein HNP98_002915 [Hymenobacter sp. 9A]|uniref:DUF5723 domain-containing protein n=1 Tax=Hymenobacter caeli TaxID=2735894 RepID=A0ABX2FUA6_9BACT|nr:hypothetical protein [Hymenobacter caeli]
MSLQIRGPSVLVNIGKQGGIAFSVRTRQAFQGNTIAPSLLKTSIGGLTSPANWSGATFNLNATALSEWNGSYGRVLLEKGAHQLKVGVTVKHLFGIGAAYLQGRDVNYEVLSSPAGGDSLLLVHDFQGAYGVANADAFRELDLLKTIGWLTGRNASGYGWGADVGVAYEYRPSSPIAEAGAPLPSDKSYRFRVGAALVDLGSVYYDKSSRSYPSIELHEAHVSQDDASNFYPTNFDNKLSDIMRLRRLSAQPSLRTGLPTVLNLDLDYHMRRSLYLNAAVSQGLRGHYAIGMRSFSYASLTPRLETRGLEVAVPLYMMNDYRNFATGFTLRFRSLRVGTNNVMGFFSKTNPYGMSCYVEGSLLEFEKGKSSKRGRHSKRRQVLTPP